MAGSRTAKGIGVVAKTTAPGGLWLHARGQGEAVFDELRDKWKRKIGAKQLERLESDLAVLVGVSPVRVETPGWIAHSLDKTT
jgi:hypothetical protein